MENLFAISIVCETHSIVTVMAIALFTIGFALGILGSRALLFSANKQIKAAKKSGAKKSLFLLAASAASALFTGRAAAQDTSPGWDEEHYRSYYCPSLWDDITDNGDYFLLMLLIGLALGFFIGTVVIYGIRIAHKLSKKH